MKSVQFNSDVISPGKVICVGRNYLQHINELNNIPPEELLFFIKPNSALSETLLLPDNEPLHYECELALLMRQGQVKGVGLGLDLTKRELQAKLKLQGHPWERSKSFKRSIVFSKFVSLTKAISELKFELWIDGELKQQGTPSQMIWDTQQIIHEAEKVFGIDDGDIIMTGTPSGVGALQAHSKLKGLLMIGDERIVEVDWHAEPA